MGFRMNLTTINRIALNYQRRRREFPSAWQSNVGGGAALARSSRAIGGHCPNAEALLDTLRLMIRSPVRATKRGKRRRMREAHQAG